MNQTHIDKAIAMIRKAAQLSEQIYHKPLYLAFSGGKDSQCIYHLAKMSGVKFESWFSPTTVDPPELLRFIRSHYPDVNFVKPKFSIYEIAKRKLLPTRQIRWCCAEFKEKHGANRVVVVGVRRAESQRRSKRDYAEKVHKNPAKRKQWNFDQFTEHTEVVSQCMGSGREKLVISPILEWTDFDVWDFLNNVVKVEHCKINDQGHNRIGCILCPMSNLKQKRRDIIENPHVANKWKEVIQYCIDNKFKNWDLNTEQTFEWWISGINKKQWIAENISQYKLKFDGE